MVTPGLAGGHGRWRICLLALRGLEAQVGLRIGDLLCVANYVSVVRVVLCTSANVIGVCSDSAHLARRRLRFGMR